MDYIITWFLFLASVYLVITSLILLRNRYELTTLPEGNQKKNSYPFFSILIPARNEEKYIEKCVQMACNQEYPAYEVIVLDDRSTDRTPEILANLQKKFPDLLITVKGRKKPSNWLGKPWACTQLVEMSKGRFILFIDADVYLQSDTLKRHESAFEQYRLDMLTVWPRQVTETFWEKTLIPLIYHALITLLPSIYVYRKPRWMPERLYNKTRILFSAACGQCISFNRNSYLAVGGHGTVKQNIVEDVGLARAVLRQNMAMRMFEGTGTIECRMYCSEKEIRSGFRKNFFAGFGYSYMFFLGSALLHLVVYILPFVILPLSLFTAHPEWLFFSTAAVSLIVLQRLILSVWFRWNPLFALTHPLAVLWFQFLGAMTLFDNIKGKKTVWKGRIV